MSAASKARKMTCSEVANNQEVAIKRLQNLVFFAVEHVVVFSFRLQLIYQHFVRQLYRQPAFIEGYERVERGLREG